MTGTPARMSVPWLLAGGGAFVGGAIARANLGAHLTRPGTVATLCFALALVQVAGGVAGARVRERLTPALATARLAVPLLALSAWTGEGKELWGALVVWVAWRDTQLGLSRTHPLLPVGAALALTLAENALHPGAPASRALLVALVAALAAGNAREASTDATSPRA